MPAIAVLSAAHIHTQGFLCDLRAGIGGLSAGPVWDDDRARGQRYAVEYSTTYEPELVRVLADPAIAGFVVCAETVHHLAVLRQVIPLGKPIICEKPLAIGGADAVAIAALADRHGTQLMLAYGYPYHGPMIRARRLIATGAFGRITRVRMRNAHHGAYAGWFEHPDLAWFYRDELAGGGAFLDEGTHAVNLLRWLFGPVRESWALIGNESGRYPSDDFGIAHLRFASGVLGTVEAAWTQTGGSKGLEIIGSDLALWHDGRGYVTATPGGKPRPLISAAEPPRGTARLAEAVAGRLDRDELADDLACAVDTVLIMEACYASARAGRWMPVARAADFALADAPAQSLPAAAGH